MYKFTINQKQIDKISKICDEKGYKEMTLDQLRNVVYGIDESENKSLYHHSSMKTKEQILDFLYGWHWYTLNNAHLLN